VTRLWGWIAGVQFLARAGIFSLCRCIQTGSETHPAPYQMGTGGSFLVIMWFGHETDHSSPSNAKVKNMRSCTSTPHVYSWHGV